MHNRVFGHLSNIILHRHCLPRPLHPPGLQGVSERPFHASPPPELFLVSRHAYKEASKDLLDGNFYTVNVFCMALPVIFIFLILVVLFTPFSSKETRPVEPPESTRGSTIPVSRRAKQPTTATDSSMRKVAKDD